MADRRYETLVLIHPEQGEAGSKELAARIRTLIEEQGGTVSQVQEWGLRDLAYLVEKQRRAFYVLFEYRASSKGLDEIERNLKLMDPVLRFIAVRQAENAPPAAVRPARRPDREEGAGTPRPGGGRHCAGGGAGAAAASGDGPAEGLPVLRRQDHAHRLQGLTDARDVPHRARQDHSRPHHRDLRPPPAAPHGRHQAGAHGGPAAVHQRLPLRRASWRSRSSCATTCP